MFNHSVTDAFGVLNIYLLALNRTGNTLYLYLETVK